MGDGGQPLSQQPDEQRERQAGGDAERQHPYADTGTRSPLVRPPVPRPI